MKKVLKKSEVLQEGYIMGLKKARDIIAESIEDEGEEKVFKLKVKLVQEGWVKIKADSLEEAISEFYYSSDSDFFPLGMKDNDEVVDYEFDQADVSCTEYKED